MSLPPDLAARLRPYLDPGPAGEEQRPPLTAELEALQRVLLRPDDALAEVLRAAVLLAQARALAARAAAQAEHEPLVRAALACAREGDRDALAALARHLGVDAEEGSGLEGPPPPTRSARRRVLRAALAFAAGAAALPLLVVVLGRAAGPGWGGGRAASGLPRTPEVDGPQLRDGYSNIERADYVGPQACAECHVEQHQAWSAHPHARMNQDARAETVQGDFTGARVAYGAIEAVFDQAGDTYRMTLFEGGALLRRYRVTRTVGSRLTQLYVGVQLEGPERAGDAVYATESKLPFGYWTARRRWLPVNYFDSDHAPDYDAAGSNAQAVQSLTALHRWEASCIFCHNTYPYAARLETGRSMTTGFPSHDLWLEPAAERPARRTLAPDELVTLGISCESCHFGGREHVERELAPRFVPSAPDLSFPVATRRLVEEARGSPYVIGSICAQCHSARVSLYPDQSATWNSREVPDLLSGACASRIKCTDCHDPHQAGPLREGPDAPGHVQTCLDCHPALQDTAARAAHTRHPEAVSCLDCHMPRVVQGLDAVIRTHHIGSPTEVAMLREAAPNACNLCHLDRSIAWTLDALRAWGAELAPDAAWAERYGGLTRPVGEVWLGHSIPIARLVAADAYARSPGARAALPRLVDALMDEVPVNRMFALFAVERALGRALSPAEYDPTAPPEPRARQVRALRASLGPD